MGKKGKRGKNTTKKKEEKKKKKEIEEINRRLREFKLKSTKLLQIHRRESKNFSLKDKLEYFRKGFQLLENGAATNGVEKGDFKIVTSNWKNEIKNLEDQLGAAGKVYEGETKGETKEEPLELRAMTEAHAQRVLYPAHTTHVIQPFDVAPQPDGRGKNTKTDQHHSNIFNVQKHKGGRKRRRKTKKRRRKTRRKTRKRKTKRKMRARAK